MFTIAFTDVQGSADFVINFTNTTGDNPVFGVNSTLNRRQIALSSDKDGNIMTCKVSISKV